MIKNLKQISSKYKDVCATAHIRGAALLAKHGQAVMFLGGVALLTHGLESLSHAQVIGVPGAGGAGGAGGASALQIDTKAIKAAYCGLIGLMQGSFGALITAVAGIGAIIASAVGAYRAAMNFIVVACGSFILQAMVDLFFNVDCGDLTNVEKAP